MKRGACRSGGGGGGGVEDEEIFKVREQGAVSNWRRRRRESGSVPVRI